MATFYVDPIGGNDANDGTTFANRWQTFSSGATAARIAPGDVIRMIASPDPTSMAQNATWTDGDQAVTLTTAVTADVTQATTAWTASASVTTTTSTNRKLGAASSSIAVAAAFTTGKAAYLNLGTTLDLSGYQQVSFWINMTAGSMTADGDMTLRLCSDTAGNTTVNTITIPRIRATSTWQAYTVDLGTALGSSIQSIALYVAVDRGAQTVLINNVLACKASSADDSLSLTSLVSKNTTNEPWLGLQSISGTTLQLEFNPQLSIASSISRGYSGATATQTIYKREALQLPSALVASTLASIVGVFGTNESGTAGSPITYSGGWNRTDMSTQTGDTYISGVNSGASGFASRPYSYITVEKINPTRFYYGMILYGETTALTNVVITASDINNNSTAGVIISGNGGEFCVNNSFTVTNIQGNGNVNTNASAGIYCNIRQFNNTVNVVNLNSNQVNGLYLGNTALTAAGLKSYSPYNNSFTFTNVNRNSGSSSFNSYGAGIFVGSASNNTITIENCDFNYGFGITLTDGAANNNISVTSSASNSVAASQPYFLFGLANNNMIDLTGATVSTSTASYSVMSANSSSNNKINNGTFVGSTAIHFVMNDSSTLTAINPTFTSGTFYGFSSNSGAALTFSNYGGSTSDQRIYYRGPYGNILTDSTTRHTASGISWKMTVSNTAKNLGPSSAFPMTLPVAKIACNASTLVTASVWVYRTDTSLTTNFVCPKNQIAGVTSDVVATAGAAINTWEQLTITFTPTQQGVVELFVQCYGAAASVYVDDFSVSQA